MLTALPNMMSTYTTVTVAWLSSDRDLINNSFSDRQTVDYMIYVIFSTLSTKNDQIMGEIT